MVADLFDSLLQELGEAMEIEDLHLDANNTCLIRFQSGLEVYIEPYEKDEFMLISTDLELVPAGRYREEVYREALKANELSNKHPGVFGHSEQSDHLILFGMLSLRELNGEKIATFLYPFIEKAERWKIAIQNGDVPLADTMTTGRPAGPGGLFGLRP